MTCEWLRGGVAPDQECAKVERRPLRVVDCYGPVCHQWPDFDTQILGG